MDALQIGSLIFFVVVIVGYVLWLRWMRGSVREISAKQKGGLRDNPEVAKQIQNVYIVHLCFIAAQVILCAITVFSPLSAIGWMIAIPLLFALNFGSRLRAKKVMLELLEEGKA